MAEGDVRQKLAAILAADVVGYTRLMADDEPATITSITECRTIFADHIEANGGRVVDMAGDSVLAIFDSAAGAVRASVNVQAALAERNETLADERRMRFRIGVNLGDIREADDGTVYGDGVNVAARLEGLAEPSGVMLSEDTYRQVRRDPDLTFSDAGTHDVKNISEPVRAYHVESGSTNTTVAPASEPITDRPTIVVLPFENMSGDVEQSYFSDGITEDIITDLSKVSGLLVIARNSAFVYKGHAYNVSDVCRELGVKFAVEGSICKARNRVRITAQLIDGSSGGHLWAERYDRDLTDIFEVQDDVTRHIVDALKVTLSEAEKSLIIDGGTRNVEAHDFFLRGRELLFQPERNREMFEKSMACFRRSIELDPDFGGPYAGLAMAYILDYQNRWSGSPEASIEEAERFANEAISREDKDPFAHYVAAIIAMWRKDYERWANEADRALSLNPNHSLALGARGIVYISVGEPAKAIPYLERAMRVDPAFRHQHIHFLGVAQFVAGDYEAAVQLFRERISIHPTTDLSRAFLASALGHLNQLDEARRIWDELKDINPDYSHVKHIGRLPFKDLADAAKFIDGLRKAGVAE